MRWFRRRDVPPLGRKGEQIAVRFLKRNGLKMLARNYRSPTGEADLIVLDTTTRKAQGAETIAFVEVKTRSCDRYTDPESAVDTDKRRRIRKVSEYYLAHHPAEGYNVRFDIVSVVIQDQGKPEINYIQDAF